MQIIGDVIGLDKMYLYGKINGNLLDLGEVERQEDGFWMFAESYDELPSMAIWAVAGYLYKINHS